MALQKSLYYSSSSCGQVLHLYFTKNQHLIVVFLCIVVLSFTFFAVDHHCFMCYVSVMCRRLTPSLTECDGDEGLTVLGCRADILGAIS